MLHDSRARLGLDWLQTARTANELLRQLMDLDYPDGIVAAKMREAVAALVEL